jgi:hypothetical protein
VFLTSVVRIVRWRVWCIAMEFGVCSFRDTPVTLDGVLLLRFHWSGLVVVTWRFLDFGLVVSKVDGGDDSGI